MENNDYEVGQRVVLVEQSEYTKSGGLEIGNVGTVILNYSTSTSSPMVRVKWDRFGAPINVLGHQLEPYRISPKSQKPSAANTLEPVSEPKYSRRIEQLMQLVTVTWDGSLISKGERDELVRCGYVEWTNGWNFITKAGLAVLVNLGLLKADPSFLYQERM